MNQAGVSPRQVEMPRLHVGTDAGSVQPGSCSPLWHLQPCPGSPTGPSSFRRGSTARQASAARAAPHHQASRTNSDERMSNGEVRQVHCGWSLVSRVVARRRSGRSIRSWTESGIQQDERTDQRRFLRDVIGAASASSSAARAGPPSCRDVPADEWRLLGCRDGMVTSGWSCAVEFAGQRSGAGADRTFAGPANTRAGAGPDLRAQQGRRPKGLDPTFAGQIGMAGHLGE